MISSKIMMAIATTISLPLFADVCVEDVKCTPRYPWNGLVDIEYTIACDNPSADIYVNPIGFNGDEGLTVFMTSLSGDGATNTVKAGTHRMTWDAQSDLGDLYAAKNFSVKIFAGEKLAPYVVIDVSGGSNADNYPIRYSLVGPDLSDDTCRTTEIWLRLVLPGTFMYGCPPGEVGGFYDAGETYCRATLTQPFYIGVFETTLYQWNCVKGSNPAGTKPVNHISFYEIWNTYIATDSPQSSSFFYRLRSKTGKTGFTLPTEMQWEYACRAGTRTALNTGKNLISNTGDENMSQAGRYNVNGGELAVVGCYLPNKLGLYDMHGNAWEICRDRYTAQQYRYDGIVDYFQTELYDNYNQSGQVVKGGSFRDNARVCRSASRTRQSSGGSYNGGGAEHVSFRICATASLQE